MVMRCIWRRAHLDMRSQMSKKNNQNTRRKQHAFDLQREAAVKKKTAVKAAAKQRALAAKPKQLKGGKKAKGIRIRKNVVVAVRLTGPSMGCLTQACCCIAVCASLPLGAVPHRHDFVATGHQGEGRSQQAGSERGREGAPTGRRHGGG